jgi:hypothetical protein
MKTTIAYSSAYLYHRHTVSSPLECVSILHREKKERENGGNNLEKARAIIYISLPFCAFLLFLRFQNKQKRQRKQKQKGTSTTRKTKQQHPKSKQKREQKLQRLSYLTLSPPSLFLFLSFTTHTQHTRAFYLSLSLSLSLFCQCSALPHTLIFPCQTFLLLRTSAFSPRALFRDRHYQARQAHGHRVRHRHGGGPGRSHIRAAGSC